MPSPASSPRTPLPQIAHRCPVCAKQHWVSAARAEMAYGRQLSCSPDCEGERRRRARAPYRVARLPIAG
jgi:hypothetical protein